MPHTRRRLRTGSSASFVVTALGFCLGFAFGCTNAEHSIAPAASEASLPPPELLERQRAAVLEAIARYQREETSWITGPAIAPQFCLLPPSAPRHGGPKDSSTGSTLSHGGRKVYHLYASNAEAYDAHVRDGSAVEPGFFLIKESWHARETEQQSSRRMDSRPHLYEWAVRGPDDRFYLPDEPYGLFVMLKEPDDAPHTDRGWVYATASFDAREVFEVGRIASCIQCHQHAPHQRLYGPGRARIRWERDADPAPGE